MPSNQWRSALWNTVKSRLGLDGPIAADPDLPKGLQAINDNDLDLAIACVTATSRRFPKDPYPYYNRGNAHFHKQDYERALADFSRAIEVSPTFAQAYYSRA